MPAAYALLRDRTLLGAAFSLLLALSWPGVEAHAEGDIAPSARDLTSLSAPTAAPSPLPARGASCDPNAAMLDPQRVASQRAAMQRMVAAMQAEGAVAMNGRGLAYAQDRDPMLELARIHAEARAAQPRE